VANFTVKTLDNLPPAQNGKREAYHDEKVKGLTLRITDKGVKSLDDMRDIASKAVSQTCKMALLLHLADNPKLLNQSESTIDQETWLKAEALGKYHLNEAVRIQRLSAEDTAINMAKRILKWIKQSRSVELSQLPTYRSLFPDHDQRLLRPERVARYLLTIIT
jgi:hypothetical protein